MSQTPTPADAQTLLACMPDPSSVRRLEDVLLQMPQIDLHTQMLVHGGMAARTITIPAGTVLTGALTNCDNICVCCGDITVTTDAGTQHLVGVHVLPARAGAKRAGIAHSDTVWVTIHRTDLTEPDAIDAEMTNEHARLQTSTQRLTWEVE